MNKQLIAVVVGAVVLFAVALFAALAFTGNNSDAGNVHTMPNGQRMSGSMHTGSTMGHTMSNGHMMTGQMPGMDTSP